ncbi:MAG TPA: DUF3299 domain-containing protein [Verrucomicrobiae bacterium]
MQKKTQFVSLKALRGAALACAAFAMFLAGCSKEQSSTSASAPEVRGEPIKGEPIQPAPAVATVTATPASAAPAAAPAKTASDEFSAVGFDKLAGFTYEMPDETNVKTNAPAAPAKEQIPADIKKLNNQRVALQGFMLPLKVEGGLITELLIMRDQSMCCYGSVPRINEWVSVKMTNKGVKPIMDQTVTLYGTLKVGEMYENGYLVGIYAMDGEKMTAPLDL